MAGPGREIISNPVLDDNGNIAIGLSLPFTVTMVNYLG